MAILVNYEFRDAIIAAGNPLNGLAILETREPAATSATFRTVSIADGETASAISYPVVDGLFMPLEIAQGAVRSANSPESAKGALAFSAPLDGQTAGGPIVDQHGDVIGITVQKPSATRPSGVGYGISNALILKFLTAAGVEISTREAAGLSHPAPEQDAASSAGEYTVPVLCFR